MTSAQLMHFRSRMKLRDTSPTLPLSFTPIYFEYQIIHLSAVYCCFICSFVYIYFRRARRRRHHLLVLQEGQTQHYLSWCQPLGSFCRHVSQRSKEEEIGKRGETKGADREGRGGRFSFYPLGATMLNGATSANFTLPPICKDFTCTTWSSEVCPFLPSPSFSPSSRYFSLPLFLTLLSSIGSVHIP